VERDAWRIIETIIRRYPKTKRKYEEYMEEVIMTQQPPETNIFRDAKEEENKPQSVTEAKALKMTSAYAYRNKQEIEAVEFCYNNLRPEEQKVIRERYWTGDGKKPVPYLQITGTKYSERQMKRIVFKMVYQVGKYIGEVK